MRLEESRWCDKFVVSHYMLGSTVAGAHHLTSTQSIAPSQGRSLSGLKAQLLFACWMILLRSWWKSVQCIGMNDHFDRVFFLYRKRQSHGANEDEALKYLCFTTFFEYIHTYHIYIYICILYVLHQNSLLGCTILSSMNHLEPFCRMSKNHVFFAAPRRLVNWGRWGTEITESCTKFVVEFGCETRQLPFLSLYSHGLFHTNPYQSNVWAAVLFLQVMSSPDALNGRPVAAAVPLREPILSRWF